MTFGACILILCLVFFTCGNFQSSSTFTCTPFQGFLEGKYTQGKPKACPTGKCLTFYVYCEDYWTTQCYDPLKPMGIINEYKPAKSFFANPKKFWYLMKCGQDGSCIDIGSDPISFDYQLWPKLKKPAARVVENIISVANLIESERIEFIGEIQKAATQVWIRIDILTEKGGYKKYKFIFGIPKQQYQLAGKKWKSAKDWETKLAKGSNLTISINSGGRTLDIFANGNNLGTTISHPNGYLVSIAFGGKWIPKKIWSNSASYSDTDGNIKTLAPKFSVFQPTNLNVACKPNTIQPASTIKYKDIKKLMSQNGTITIPLSRNSMIGYGHEVIELRESLCQNSDIALIEIGSWKQGKDGQFRIYVEMWPRTFNDWYDMKMANIDAAQCKTYQITVQNHGVNFLCDNVNLVSIDYFNVKTSISYLVEQTEREIVCNK